MTFATGATTTFAAGTSIVFEAGAAVFEFASAEAEFELASAGAAVFALASAVFVFAADESAGASGFADRTETFPVSAGIDSKSADTIKVAAAAIVTFDRTVAVPRGENAELETLLVNRAPASVLPG